jgi:hypothetical protein
MKLPQNIITYLRDIIDNVQDGAADSYKRIKARLLDLCAPS